MFTNSRNRLFAKGDLARTLDSHLEKINEEVNNIPKDQFLFSTDQDIVDYVFSKMVINPIDLHLDSMVMESEEIQIDYQVRDERRVIKIPGVRVTVFIPFSGDEILWKLRPSSGYLTFPDGIIHPQRGRELGYLEIVFEQRAEESPENLKQSLDHNLNLIKDYLKNQLRDINPRNEQLPNRIRNAIKARRDRLEKQEGLIKHLNIPLKSKDGVPPIRPIQVERRLVHQLPTPPKGGHKQEWGISDNDYEDILSIIRHEGRTFESTPFTYKIHDEEGLRNIILAHLNGHYKGGATGETFRRVGKTDIRIEMENRAAFIAECKVWRGSHELNSALDQLLGYLIWYDCKTALVIFNKHNAKFTQLLKKAPITIQGHSKYLKYIDENSPSEWRYKFASPEDENRHITIHVFLFNLYAK